MNYIWSKLSLLKFIEEKINKIVWDKNYIFSDLFAGTWIVARFFKEKWHQIIANDLQYYSYALNRNYIWNHTDLYFAGIRDEVTDLFVSDVNTHKEVVCKYLNNLPGKKWFIYKNYSLGWTKGQEFERMYFSDENALKCDAIRQKIEFWKSKNKITDDEYYFLIASLLEAIDKVANTASVYGAFLKQLKKSALKPLNLVPADFHKTTKISQVYNVDINKLIKNTTHDVVYLDPPYNERQYSSNYHILETIAKYDNPTIKWKTGLRDYSSQKSLYCKKSEVLKSFDDLIQNIDAKYIFLSYNCEWLMSLEDIKNIMSKRWEYWVFTQEYKRFKADKTESRNHKKKWVIEYLHYVKISNY